MKNTVDLPIRTDARVDPKIVFPSDEDITKLIKGGDDAVIQIVAKLGYTPPSLQLQIDSNKKKGVELYEAKSTFGELAKVLRGAGIKPFTNESVEAYQRSLSVPPRRRFQLIDRQFMGIPKKFIWWAIAASSLLSFVCYYFAAVAVHEWIYSSFKPLYFLWFPIVMIFVAGLTDGGKSYLLTWISNHVFFSLFGPLAWVMMLFGPSLVIREWHKVPLSDFKKDIPRPVLETIAEIHSRCPSAKFFVEELQMKPDPFLRIELGREKYYVEVWDEPKFKGKKLA